MTMASVSAGSVIARKYSQALDVWSTSEIAGSSGIMTTKASSRIVASRKSGSDRSTSVTTEKAWSTARSRFSACSSAGMIVSGR